MPRWVVRSVMLIIIAPVLGVFVWYGVSFYPYIDKLDEISSNGTKSIDSITPEFYKYAVVAESKNGIRIYSMRQAYWSLVFSGKQRRNNLEWHGNNLLWVMASYIHFDENEIFGIWVNCAVFGCGKGLNAVALKYYGKALYNLNEKELAGMAALVRNPQKYKPGSERSEERIRVIIEKTVNPDTHHNKSL